MVRSSTIISSFGLMAAGMALPTSTETTNLETREWKECAPGTSYFKCYTYDGCYASDPCITPPPTQPSCTNGATSKDQRAMHVVIPSDADRSEPSVGYFQVVSGQMDIDQVGIFSGIPADAKTCTLHWKQGGPNERVFKVTGNGRVSAIQLDSLDTSNGVSWSDVTKANAISAEFGPDLSFWDAPEYPATEHGSWDLTCAETIYMKFETHKGSENQNVNDYRNVYLEQDDKNGWYVQYTC